MIKRLLICLIVALWLAIPTFALAQDVKGAPGDAPEYVLTDQEKAQWNQWGQQEQRFVQQYDAGILLAVSTTVGDQSKEVHGAIQQAWLSLNLVRARRGEFLAQLRADHDCKDCEIKGGKLVKPGAK